MTPTRVAAALAAMVSALLLQATLVEPLTGSAAITVPAVLVACVALVDGPGTGMAFGFALGLVADLGSRHPAGILALTWLGLGLVAGRLAAERSARGDALVAGVLTGVAALFAAVLLAVTRADGADLGAAFATWVPSVVGDAVLACAIAPMARRFLRAHAMRSPAAVSRDVVLGAGRV